MRYYQRVSILASLLTNDIVTTGSNPDCVEQLKDVARVTSTDGRRIEYGAAPSLHAGDFSPACVCSL